MSNEEINPASDYNISEEIKDPQEISPIGDQRVPIKIKNVF